jgi:hypothetical protein
MTASAQSRDLCRNRVFHRCQPGQRLRVLSYQ